MEQLVKDSSANLAMGYGVFLDYRWPLGETINNEGDMDGQNPGREDAL
jgi:hypothetical protein